MSGIKKIKIGFTLAEILVTLGVIGVIASMTVPNLIQDAQEAQFKGAWKKTFAEFSQAIKILSMEKSGDFKDVFPEGDTATGFKNFRNAFLPYLNYTKTCEPNTSGCWHEANEWYNLSGVKRIDSYKSHATLILNNGTLASFRLYSSSCNDTRSPNNDNCGNVYFDINGFKGPNKIGKDIYVLRVLRRGNVIPQGTQGDYVYNNPSSYSCNVQAYPNTEGWGCSADYLYK
jgi:prepilin-type N-terminal cleavage/methylation domain-containing protein